MTKVSVLVTVYNGEKFLDKCLASLHRQTYDNIEIVCVNDGSTDSTPDIMRRWQQQDGRIKMVEHYPNKGLATSHNEGLQVCTGDVIAYLDCDDWFADDSIERLVRVFDSHEDADCVLLKCIFVYPDGREEEYQGLHFGSLDGKTAFRESLTWRVHGVYAARRELYERCNFDATCPHFSNDNTTRIHYFMSRRVYESDAPYYYYQNPDSITYKVSVRRMDYMLATESMKRQLISLNCPRDIMALYEDERWIVIVDSYKFYFKNRSVLSAEDAAYCRKEIKLRFGNIEPQLLSPSLKRKFGYSPLGKSWLLFRLEEEIYFTLRKLLRRL
jgi:glycosyltransferase involved in cell wall biosynthesis